jgi:hypothetical protein
VLPGMGKGITEESTTETRKSPSGPSFVSQCGMSGWCWRGAAAGGGGANVLTKTWTYERSARPPGGGESSGAGGESRD